MRCCPRSPYDPQNYLLQWRLHMRELINELFNMFVGGESVFRSGDDADSDGVLCLREGAEAGKERPPFWKTGFSADDPQPPWPGWGAAAGKTQNRVCTLQRMEPRAGGNNPAVQKKGNENEWLVSVIPGKGRIYFSHVCE